jgi:hypothetical protein
VRIPVPREHDRERLSGERFEHEPHLGRTVRARAVDLQVHGRGHERMRGVRDVAHQRHEPAGHALALEQQPLRPRKRHQASIGQRPARQDRKAEQRLGVVRRRRGQRIVVPAARAFEEQRTPRGVEPEARGQLARDVAVPRACHSKVDLVQCQQVHAHQCRVGLERARDGVEAVAVLEVPVADAEPGPVARLVAHLVGSP